MTPLRRRIAAAALTFSLALGVSGCGAATTTTSSPSQAAVAKMPSAEELWTSTQASLSAATSAHVTGSVVSNGTPMTVDMAGTRDGTNQRVAMTSDGTHAEIVTVGGTDYITADAAFWTKQGATQAQAQQLVGKYVTRQSQTPPSFSLGTLFDSLSKESFGVVDKLNLKVDKVDLNGTQAYKISERVASSAAVNLWVSSDGKNNILRLEVNDDSGNPQQLAFSEWNSVAPFTPPPADKIVQQ